MPKNNKRRVCFVTGTRAEFGLMRTTLEAIRGHESLRLQVVATGMHLDPRHGQMLESIQSAGFEPDAVVDWPQQSGHSPAFRAINTGKAMADLSAAFVNLKSDIVLVVGDRVEAFAAAAAAHLSNRILAHVHGGDRALGQIDDSLRHAITKLAHLHFPATPQSAERIGRLGEDPWRIHQIGSPGNDRIEELAAPWDDLAARFPGLGRHRYALLVLHPASSDPRIEKGRAEITLATVRRSGFERIVIVHPNNDPGCRGIQRAWAALADDPQVTCCKDLPRSIFLGLMRDAAVLAGNSSSGIIEAASFQTPVADIGPRQEGRECSENVIHCEYDAEELALALSRIWNGGRPKKAECRNIYGSGDVGRKMAEILATAGPRERLLRKLITY